MFMAVHVKELSEIPKDNVNYYILWLSSGYKTSVVDAFNKNFLHFAEDVGGQNAVIKGFQEKHLFQQVKSAVTRAQGYQDTPFERIIQKISHDRNPAYNPLLQTWFTFQEPPMVLDLAGTDVTSLTIHNGGAKLDLSFWLWEEDSTIKGLIEFNTDLFNRSSIERIAGHYEQLLKEIISDPTQAVDSLELLTTEEQAQIFSWCRWAVTSAS